MATIDDLFEPSAPFFDEQLDQLIAATSPIERSDSGAQPSYVAPVEAPQAEPSRVRLDAPTRGVTATPPARAELHGATNGAPQRGGTAGARVSVGLEREPAEPLGPALREDLVAAGLRWPRGRSIGFIVCVALAVVVGLGWWLALDGERASSVDPRARSRFE